MTEDSLLTSPLEYTNEPYAIAKIAGIKLCESYNIQYGTNFISVMPTNLYGPNDNFDLEKSHVLPALLRKIYLGKCLEENNWDAIRSDLNKRPIEGTNGDTSTKKTLLLYLPRYGVFARSETTKQPYSESPNYPFPSKYGAAVNPCVSSSGVKKWQMPVFTLWRMLTSTISFRPI